MSYGAQFLHLEVACAPPKIFTQLCHACTNCLISRGFFCVRSRMNHVIQKEFADRFCFHGFSFGKAEKVPFPWGAMSDIGLPPPPPPPPPQDDGEATALKSADICHVETWNNKTSRLLVETLLAPLLTSQNKIFKIVWKPLLRQKHVLLHCLEVQPPPLVLRRSCRFA